MFKKWKIFKSDVEWHMHNAGNNLHDAIRQERCSIDEKFLDQQKQLDKLEYHHHEHRHCPKCGYVLREVARTGKELIKIKIYMTCREGHDYYYRSRDSELIPVKGGK